MADTISATIHELPQPRRKAKSGAQRQREYKQRLKAKAAALPAVIAPEPIDDYDGWHPADDVTPPSAVTSPAPKSANFASLALRAAALGLGGVGIVMNSYFAMTLGSGELAGYLFLALGLASDVAALALPAVASGLWRRGERGSAMTGWMVWATLLAFALMSGVGFASTSISDVTAARGNRVTATVVTAKAALDDAMVARDRECKGGVGRYCRDREQQVVDRRAALDRATGEVQAASDPQTVAAVRLATWASGGMVRPTSDDIAMLRLLLLTLLPQAGGVMLMLSRSGRNGEDWTVLQSAGVARPA